MEKISGDDFHESAVRGLRAMHKRGEISDMEMQEQEEWWARGGHLDQEGEYTVTWVVNQDPGLER